MQTETGRLCDGLQAAVSVEFGIEQPIEFFLDTGFSGFLCFPCTMLKELWLTITGTTDIEGIGDHAETLDVCITDIYWLGEKRTKIEIFINEGEDFLPDY